MKRPLVSNNAADPVQPAPAVSFEVHGITDRRRYQTLLYSGGGAVFILDEHGVIQYLTTPAEHFFSSETEEIIGQPFLSFLHRRDLYQAVCNLDKLIAGRKTRVSWMFRLRDQHKQWRWLKATAVRFSYQNDRRIIAILLQDLINVSSH